MIRRLRAVFHLAETLMDIAGRLADGLGEQLVIHEMGAGAGGQIASIPDKLHRPQVDLPIAFDGVLNGSNTSAH